MNNTINSQVSFGRVYINKEAKKIIFRRLSGYSKNKCNKFEKMIAEQEFNPIDINITNGFTIIRAGFLKAMIGDRSGLCELSVSPNPLRLMKAACKLANSEHAKLDSQKTTQERVIELLKQIPEK